MDRFLDQGYTEEDIKLVIDDPLLLVDPVFFYSLLFTARISNTCVCKRSTCVVCSPQAAIIKVDKFKAQPLNDGPVVYAPRIVVNGFIDISGSINNRKLWSITSITSNSIVRKFVSPDLDRFDCIQNCIVYDSSFDKIQNDLPKVFKLDTIGTHVDFYSLTQGTFLSYKFDEHL